MSTLSHLRSWLACPDCDSRDVAVVEFSVTRLVLACNDCGTHAAMPGPTEDYPAHSSNGP